MNCKCKQYKIIFIIAIEIHFIPEKRQKEITRFMHGDLHFRLPQGIPEQFANFPRKSSFSASADRSTHEDHLPLNPSSYICASRLPWGLTTSLEQEEPNNFKISTCFLYFMQQISRLVPYPRFVCHCVNLFWQHIT